MVVNYYLSVFIQPGVDGTVPLKTKTESSRNGTGDMFKKLDSSHETVASKAMHAQVQNSQNSSDIQSTSTEVETDSEPPIDNMEVFPQNGMVWKLKHSHFCKVCKHTVPYMDHHCPFTGNCIGIENFSYFFLGLLYGTVGLGYGLALSLPYFVECKLTSTLWYFGLGAEREQSKVCDELKEHLQLFFPVLGGFCVSTIMLLLHITLLLADLSTYDVLKSFGRLPVMRFALQRIKGGKFGDSDSKLNVLLLSQRPSLLWFLVPVRNNNQLTYRKLRD